MDMRVVRQRGLLCGQVFAKLLFVCKICVWNATVANIPAAAATADIVVVSLIAAAFGNVEISCFCQAQPLRRIPTNPAELPEKERESENAKTKRRALRPGGHRNFASRESAQLWERERELARLNFKCIAWKIDIAMSATTWREHCFFCCFFFCSFVIEFVFVVRGGYMYKYKCSCCFCFIWFFFAFAFVFAFTFGVFVAGAVLYIVV